MRFLNQQIAERTCPWGELFDELGQILPAGVRLRSLDPRSAKREPRTASDEDAGARRRVALSISGVAKTETAIYKLVDALFAHPHFSAPDLKNDRRQDDRSFTFALTVRYQPIGDAAGGAS